MSRFISPRGNANGSNGSARRNASVCQDSQTAAMLHRGAKIESLESRQLMAVQPTSIDGDIQIRLPFADNVPAFVTQGYGNVGDGGHNGYAVDFRASVGTPLVSPMTGTVIDVGSNHPELGKYVTIEGQGTTSRWQVTIAHMNRTAVSKNQPISAGASIGESGNTGTSSGPHVHIQTKRADGTRVRPTPMYGTANGTSSRLITDFAEGRTYTAVAMGPIQDHFNGGAITLGTASVTLTGSTVNATRELNEPTHGGNGGASVWYRWVAPSTGTYVVDTIGSRYDTLLGVYTGNTMTTLQRLASDDDSGGNMTSKVTINATAGQGYRIAIDGYGGASGDYTLRINGSSATPSAPSNLTATRTGSGAVQLRWTNTWSSATSNRAEYWNGSNWTAFWSGAANVNTLSVTASAGANIYLRVVAVGGQGSYASDYVLATF